MKTFIVCLYCSVSVCHWWHGYHILETSGLHQNILYAKEILNTLYNGFYNRYNYHTWSEPSYME